MRISRGALACVDRVEDQGSQFVLKRYQPMARVAWAREVASHLVCPQPDIVPFETYGVDASGRGWMTMPWVNSPTVRYRLAHGSRALRSAAEMWIAGFQRRLAADGYRWVDASFRNILVRGSCRDYTQSCFSVVDYTIRALVASTCLAESVDQLISIPPGTSVANKLPRRYLQ